jgi:hypothetical protein
MAEVMTGSGLCRLGRHCRLGRSARKTALRAIGTVAFVLTLSLTISVSAHADGQTYVPPDYQPEKQTETCRFIKLERTEEGMACIYQRQTGGPNKQIEIEGHLNCLREFQCERLD